MNIIETVALTKKFDDLTANNNINFSVRDGEIHALIGENGAGKTTLMNILYGLLQPTAGEIYFKGEKVRIDNPKKAIAMGIGMVHQHFKLVSSLSILENILLGVEPQKYKVFFDRKKAEEKIKEIDKKYGLNVDYNLKIRDVSVGVQQRVEILKMLYREVDLLILDEPTAVLTPQEVDEFFKSLKNLKEKGKTVIIVTHKLEEVFKCSDRVTVMRNGKLIDTLKTQETNMKELANLMVGRNVLLEVEKQKAAPGAKLLEVKGVSTYDDRQIKVLDNVTFHVNAGEIVGIAGVQGNGQEELLRVLTGMQLATSGIIYFKEHEITNMLPGDIRELGLSHIPSDRFQYGLASEASIAENLISGYHRRPHISNGKIINLQKVNEFSNKLVCQFDIRTENIYNPVQSLSGGNAQKVILARELAAEPELIIASQPTRGVDIGAIEFIHKQLIRARDEGKGILLISTELKEIMSLSDRILVMFSGKIVGELSIDEATEEKIGLLMAGVVREV